MNLRFYIDPETDAPHIYRHGVDEAEVEDVLRRPIEGSSWTRGCPNRDRANTGRPVLASGLRPRSRARFRVSHYRVRSWPQALAGAPAP